MKNKTSAVRRGAWTAEEDSLLRKCVEKHGEGKWHLVPLKAGLNRCRKSCRLRWLNYLNPNIKRGEFSSDEVDLIIRLHKLLGNRWSLIAGRIPGRTANDVKNYWNTHLRKKLSAKSETKKAIEIIKPRPRTFSKTLPWRREKNPATVENNIPSAKSISTHYMPSQNWAPEQDLEGDVTLTQWWDSLSVENEIFGGASEDVQHLIKGLWTDQISAGKRTGDLSVDLNVWDILDSDKAFM